MPQTLSQIKDLLRSHGLRPRRSWGQNFLADPNKLREILAAAELQATDTVLEVGPGTGVLTEPMLERAGRVVAVEIDADLAEILRRRIGPDSERFTLIRGDALAGKHALNPAIEEALRGRDQPFKLIANLPYQIACPLLATLAVDWPGMTAALVMVQQEVADRLCASPGGKQFGPISVTLQAMCTCKRIITLSPHCFRPEPKVSSAVVKLTRRAAPLTADPHALQAFTARLFNQRRKQVGSILGRDHLPTAIPPTARPEQLTVEQIVMLCERYTKSLHVYDDGSAD